MKINAVSNNQNFGLKMPIRTERTLLLKMVNFPAINQDGVAGQLYRHLQGIGTNSKLKDINFYATKIGEGQHELITNIEIKVGRLLDGEVGFESMIQRSSEPFTLKHLMDAFSTLVEKIEKSYIKSRTFLIASERVKEGIPLAENKAFLADLKKIDKAVPGYTDFKKNLQDTVIKSADLM